MVQVKKLSSEGLSVQYFDLLTQKNLEIPPIAFKNTVAEYLFPNTAVSLASFYAQTTPEQLQNLVGKTLQFSNTNKGYFTDTGKELDAIYPVVSDGAAYGSIPFTECRNFHELTQAKIAIVDDATGENSLGLEPETAKRLVGDCYGQIDSSLHTSIEGEKNTPFQFRVGIPQQKTTVARIAKGTMSPKDLSDLGVDLIMAKSSFKGRKGKENNEIEVGTYNWTIGIGIKTHAYMGEQALGSQILVNYPKAVQALEPLIQERLKELTTIASEPLKLAQDYINSIERRYRFAIEKNESFQELFKDEDLTSAELDVLIDVAASAKNEERYYHLIKADVEGHRQLLEHPAVVSTLNEHLRKQYLELATGRFAKFQGALLQPTEQLKENEFFDANLPDGVKVLVTRSPFLNSNNLIELTNRHIEELKNLQGVVFMNPKTAASALQGDFDGDRVAYQEIPESINLNASKEEQLWQNFLITLAKESGEKQLPENRYADVIKKAKVPYTGSIEKVALSAKENQIGLIAKRVMKVIAMENEIDFIPESEKAFYLSSVAEHFRSLAAKPDLFKKWLGNADLNSEYHQQMLALTTSLSSQVKQLAKLNQDDRSIDEKLALVKNFHHQLVGVLGNELQVAVDGPKSALRPDQDILKTIKALSNYRQMAWLEDYKSEEVFKERPMRSNGFSPIDRMVRLVNESFVDHQLIARPSAQFRPLFGDVSHTEAQKELMQAARTEHNRLFSKAFDLQKEFREYPGPRMTLSSPSGKQLEVIGLEESEHPLTFSLEKMKVRIKTNKELQTHRYVVLAEVSGEINELGQPEYKHIGYLSKNSETEHRSVVEKLLENKSAANLGVTDQT
jgi:hypothetical protein